MEEYYLSKLQHFKIKMVRLEYLYLVTIVVVQVMSSSLRSHGLHGLHGTAVQPGLPVPHYLPEFVKVCRSSCPLNW